MTTKKRTFEELIDLAIQKHNCEPSDCPPCQTCKHFTPDLGEDGACLAWMDPTSPDTLVPGCFTYESKSGTPG